MLDANRNDILNPLTTQARGTMLSQQVSNSCRFRSLV